ncbi:MAG: HAD family phosphatase [Actinobacteria bacterium]|nr:HAD family phosphatase [Actinomycetota bacterium]
MTELAAVLFDMDGTLVESESLWHEAEVAAMEFYGSTWDDDDHTFSLGGPFGRVVDYMAEKAGVTAQEMGDRLIDTIGELMRTRPFPVQPGIRELHDEITAAGIPTGLVTNSFLHLAELVLESTGFTFDVVVAGDQLPENKPHPLPYLTACAQLGVEPKDTVVLEDSVTGIASASAADCFVVIVPGKLAIEAQPRQIVVDTAADVNLKRLRSFVLAH